MSAASEMLHERLQIEQAADAPHESGDDRYAIYAVARHGFASGPDGARRKRLAETSLDGIGLTLRTLVEDGDLTQDSRVGIFDRLDRVWIVNPWATGRAS